MAEENNQEVKPAGGGKGLMIALIALVVVLLLAVVGGGFFLYSQGAFGGNTQGTEEVQKADAVEGGTSYKADMNDLVLNLTDSRGREKLMKLSFSIRSTEPKIATIVEEYKAEIIDVVISQISARSSEELLTVGGKNLLKDELMQDINNVINNATQSNSKIARNNVKTILFTTFVIK
jgi:flagellar FliL protein